MPVHCTSLTTVNFVCFQNFEIEKFNRKSVIYMIAIARCSVFNLSWLCYLWSGSTWRIPRYPPVWWAAYWGCMHYFIVFEVSHIKAVHMIQMNWYRVWHFIQLLVKNKDIGILALVNHICIILCNFCFFCGIMLYNCFVGKIWAESSTSAADKCCGWRRNL